MRRNLPSNSSGMRPRVRRSMAVVSLLIGAKLPLRYGFSAAFVDGGDFAVVRLDIQISRVCDQDDSKTSIISPVPRGAALTPRAEPSGPRRRSRRRTRAARLMRELLLEHVLQRVFDIDALSALAPLPRAPVPGPSRAQPHAPPPAGAAGKDLPADVRACRRPPAPRGCANR